ncbi:MAG TPA: hypothetical protein VK009_05975 [Chloroflexota bacterium]|nr:hypothetical protein [Chloroflexota bacterium]
MITDFAGAVDSAYALVLQPNGMLVAAGASGPDFGLARYTSSGALDGTFGTGGKVTTDFAGGTDVARGLVLQPDGKLVAAGQAAVGSGFDFGLARYASNGSLDTTFGTGGKVTTDFGTVAEAFALVLQPDGKLVAAGTASGELALARYMSNGSLDPTFGNGGLVTSIFGGAFAPVAAQGLVLQPDGKLVTVGWVLATSGPVGFALARYTADGHLDGTFGSGGWVTSTSQGIAQALVLQSDGKLVVSGRGALARYTADGQLDSTFGTGGRATAASAGVAVLLQPDGKILTAGAASLVGDDFVLARYLADGTPDSTFGTGGTVTTDLGSSNDIANALVLQPDGNLVAAGASGADFALARYLATDIAVAPTVVSPTISATAANSATLGGTVSADGGASVTERGVVYAATATNSNPHLGGAGVTKAVASSPGTGTFIVDVSGLTPSTGYSFEAYATNSVGTSYSPVDTFTTTVGAPAAPTVVSPTAAAVADTSATLGGTVSGDGGASVTERGVVYAPTAANNNPQLGGPSVTKAVASSAGTGTFTVSVSGLTANTGYSFKAYATNSVGTSYSPVSTFTTLASSCVVNTLAAGEAQGAPATAVNPTMGVRLPRLDPTVFRRLRDQVLASSPEGQRWISLYNHHSPEVVRSMLTDSTLRGDLMQGLQLWQEDVAALVDGQGSTVTIGPAEVQSLDRVLDRLAAQGSPELRRDIARERAAHPTAELLGQPIDRAAAKLVRSSSPSASTTPIPATPGHNAATSVSTAKPNASASASPTAPAAVSGTR